MSPVEHVAGVLVVGAGYAGLHAARCARRAGAAVAIIDPAGVHGFTTRLAAVAGGTAPPGDAFAPLGALVDSVYPNRVVAIEDGAVTLDDDSRLIADAVILTAGARPAMPDLPGTEFALPLRTPADALALRRVLDSSDRLSIIGGGATGAQLAGAATTARPDTTVRLIDREPRLLGSMAANLGDHAANILAARGVELYLEREVDGIEATGLRLSDGTFLPGPVVWAGGFESVVDELGSDLPLDEGRLRVRRDLRIDGWARTFAAGDVAAHREVDDELLPMSAQIAVQAGKAAGRNAARLVGGSRLGAASLSHRGWVIDLGSGRGVAQLGPLTLASSGLDRLAPLLHVAIDIKHLIDVGGPAALRFAPGRHRPPASAIERLSATRNPVGSGSRFE